jgi:N-methylhydantoinase A
MNAGDEARITCDIGGTFTDVVVSDAAGELTLAKSLTRPERLFDGLRAALVGAAAQLDEDLSDLLERTSLFIFSTTQATNAILESKTATTAFLCTEGFPDILVRREGGSLRPYDYSRPFPAPYVPRRFTFEIPERIDVHGSVILPLNEEAARSALLAARKQGIEAVSVCLLWATANPAHELALAELIEEEMPGVPFSLSHRVNPIVREYRRASSTAIDASLRPLMQRHLPEIASGLESEGFAGELLAATSVGGAVPMSELISSPLLSVRSGPSLAPVAARTIAARETGSGDVIVCDAGGTSFEVGLVRDGDLVFTNETWLGEPFAGHLTGLSSVDVRSIGAGGGSIAWVDLGGLLRVGPESAGADPGPACYGRGGSRPTVTDAALTLGYIDPDRFLGGAMKLDLAEAEAVIWELAEALSIAPKEAAHAVLSVANERMIAAIQELTVNEGVDPRDSTLVAGGGAAGLTILPIARELGCRQVLIPKAAGVLAAFGGQHSDIVREVTAPHATHSQDFDFDGVAATIADLRRRMAEFEGQLPDSFDGEVSRSYYVEARYAYQVWDVPIPLVGEGVPDQASLDALIESFHDAHERIFAVREPGQKIEMSQWKGRVIVGTRKPGAATERRSSGGAANGSGSRVAFMPDLGEVEVPIHLGAYMAPGATAEGPAIVIEPETTVVVYPGWTAQVTDSGNYRLEFG